MNNRLLYENLDTSFVNLAALIKHLRRQKFEGKIRVELKAYEADVILTADEQMRVLERDLIAGRISEGEEALQRLLIRAREAGGNICVYQNVEEIAPAFAEIESNAGKSNAAAIEASPEEMLLELPEQNENAGNTKIKTFIFEKTFTKSDTSVPDFPFDLSNKVEAQAKPLRLDDSDWQTLLNLSAELLRTVETSLGEANLDFAAMFDKARRELAADYPFLNPSIDDFKYQNGKIILREQVNFKMFAASVGELIWRILEKLGRNPKLANLYRIIGEKIRTLAAHRKDFYDKFFLTAPLEKFVQTK